MSIYLPIAEMPVDMLVVLFLGGIAGVLSGMFGIGGGFVMTPFLIFIGVPPAVAVATSANQIIAASFSGFLAHLRRNNVDLKMGAYLLLGGFVGSTIGVWIFKLLKDLGQIDLVIQVSYVGFLGVIGGMMGVESWKTIQRKKLGLPPAERRFPWQGRFKLPLQRSFPRSEIQVSLLLPLGIGFVSGMMVAIMGIGGGFFMIPAMIYLLGMPTSVVIGTSLFQIIFTSANTTFLQAITTQTVDVVLAALLLAGSVVGAQYGTRFGMKLAPEKLRGLLAIIVLVVCLRLAYTLFVTPDSMFSIEMTDRTL